jgi:hypothetical protein
MPSQRGVSSLAIDLTQLHRRTVTSFYSNLVTRPTGRAVRMGVESQLAELEGARELHLSILDFSQVRVLDYSCADEIVAKLLLRYLAADRPGEAYFLVRGLQEHHREAIEAVLERHDLLLVVQEGDGAPLLLGPTDPMQRACWSALVEVGRGTATVIAARTGLAEAAIAPTLERFVAQRVAVGLGRGHFCALSHLATPLSEG